MPLSATFRAELILAKIDSNIIAWMDLPEKRISDHTSFANFLQDRDQVQSHLLDQIGDAAIQADSGQKG